MGIGLDGGIALASGESKWITSVQSREDVHKLRAINDAILTGVGTVLDDNPSLTSRDSGYDIDKVIQPLRVVIDRNNKLTGKEEVFSDDAETIVFSNGDYDVNTSVAENIEYKNLINVMRHLAEEKQINNLLVEAGSGIFDALLTENLIDCLILYQSPKILGKNRKTFSKVIRCNPLSS